MFLNKRRKVLNKKRCSWGKFLLFFSGVLAGALLIISFAVIMILKNSDGINVYVSEQRMLGIVNKQLNQRVQEEFPEFVQGIKEEIPSLVEKHMHNFITIGNIEIGGHSVNLPPQFIDELERNIRSDVNYYVLKVLEELEKEQFVQEISCIIVDDVLETLLADLNGQVIEIPFTKHYSVPIIVWLY
ncbi:MAG: hypothetical protein GX996_04230 [Firmicutes bacterium]|nr:hypothetical protein [Bacillota bacterium]